MCHFFFSFFFFFFYSCHSIGNLSVSFEKLGNLQKKKSRPVTRIERGMFLCVRRCILHSFPFLPPFAGSSAKTALMTAEICGVGWESQSCRSWDTALSCRTAPARAIVSADASACTSAPSSLSKSSSRALKAFSCRRVPVFWEVG